MHSIISLCRNSPLSYRLIAICDNYTCGSLSRLTRTVIYRLHSCAATLQRCRMNSMHRDRELQFRLKVWFVLKSQTLFRVPHSISASEPRRMHCMCAAHTHTHIGLMLLRLYGTHSFARILSYQIESSRLVIFPNHGLPGDSTHPVRYLLSAIGVVYIPNTIENLIIKQIKDEQYKLCWQGIC